MSKDEGKGSKPVGSTSMSRPKRNAEAHSPSTAHANAIRWLSEVPTVLNHASEALGFDGEEAGAHRLIDRAIKHLLAIKEEIDAPSEPLEPPKRYPQYQAEGVPHGFDTITAFIAREAPKLMESMADPVADTQADHAELRLETRRAGQPPVKVKPSPAVAASGRSMDWAYPLGFLSRRYL